MKGFFKMFLISGGVVFYIGMILFFIFIFIVSSATFKMVGSSIAPSFRSNKGSFNKDRILHLKLNGFIYKNEFFLESLRKYSKNKKIKGVFIEINSPGGVVGTSQEIYLELKRIRDELKKPIVVFVQNLAASGAFYTAMGASQIVATPGALLGSIGVIASFTNLEKLYTWAKIKRYSITTGKFKDSGADYRPMTDEEKAFFQDLLDQSLEQFQNHIAEGRKMSLKTVKTFSDGSIFIGEKALKYGLIDKLGTYTDGVKLIGKLSKLGKEPSLFEPKLKKEVFWEFFESSEGLSSLSQWLKKIENKFSFRKNHITAVPLYLMPGVL